MAKRQQLVEDIAAGVMHADRLAADAEVARLRSEVASLRGRYKSALAAIDAERERADAIAGLSGIKPAKRAAPKKVRHAKHDATAILMLSDVHCEERVLPETVNGENDYSLDVCNARLDELQERFFRLLEHERQLTPTRSASRSAESLSSRAIRPRRASPATTVPR